MPKYIVLLILIVFGIWPQFASASDCIWTEQAVHIWKNSGYNYEKYKSLAEGSREQGEYSRQYQGGFLTPKKCYSTAGAFAFQVNDPGRYLKIKLEDGTEGWVYWTKENPVKDSQIEGYPNAPKAIAKQINTPAEERCPDDQLSSQQISKINVSQFGGIKSDEEINKYFHEHVCKATASNERCKRYETYKPIMERIAKAFEIPFGFLSCIAARESGWEFIPDKTKVESILNKSFNNIAGAGKIKTGAMAAFTSDSKSLEDYLNTQYSLPTATPAIKKAIDRTRNRLAKTAFGFMQVMPTSARDTRDRLTGKNGKTGMRDVAIRNSYQLYLDELERMRASDMAIGENALLNFGNLKALDANKDELITQMDKFGFNVPANMAIAATQISVDLWKEDIRPRDHDDVDHSNQAVMEKLLLTAGRYNKGRDGFKSVCGDKTTYSQCITKLYNRCKSSPAGHENYRYIVSMARCMSKNNNKDYQKLETTCPDPVNEGLITKGQ